MSGLLLKIRKTALHNYFENFCHEVFGEERSQKTKHFSAAPFDAYSLKQRLRYKSLFLILIALLMYYRSPYIFTFGRFWAEEGRDWFKTVYENGFFAGLFYIYDEAGYLNLFPNISVVTSSFFPLDFAPLVTTYMAASIKMVFFGLILFSNSNLFITEQSKYFGCLLALFAASSVAEVWANTINSMTYFGLIALILLFKKYENSTIISRRASRVLLFVAGLSGPYALVLYPFFLFKAYFGRIREDIFNAAVLTVCAAIQSGLFLSLLVEGVLSRNRGFFLGIDNMTAQTVQHNVLIPLFGHSFAKDLFNLIGLNSHSLYDDNDIMVTIRVFGLAIIIFTCLCVLIWRTKSKKAILVLAMIFLVLSLFSLLGALKNSIGGRYSVIPGIVLIFLIMLVYHYGKEKLIRYIAGLLLALSLFFGVQQYRTYHERFLNCVAECQDWSSELAKWRDDPSHELQIWPYPRWKMRLTPNP